MKVKSVNYLNWSDDEIREHIESLDIMIESMRRLIANPEKLKVSDFKGIMSALSEATGQRNDMQAHLRGVDEERVKAERERRDIEHMRYELSMYRAKYGPMSLGVGDIESLSEENVDED